MEWLAVPHLDLGGFSRTQEGLIIQAREYGYARVLRR